MLTKPSAELALFDTLSRLTFIGATKLPGADGSHLITAGGKYEVDIATQVEFDRDRFRLRVDSTTVTLALSRYGFLVASVHPDENTAVDCEDSPVDSRRV